MVSICAALLGLSPKSPGPADARSFSPVHRPWSQKLIAHGTPSAGMMSVTFGSPLVMVPVLSSATIWVLPVSSRDTAVLKMNAVLRAHAISHHDRHRGGKSQSAGAADYQHGDASCQGKAYGLSSQQPARAVVITAMLITAGTKMPDTLSATFAMGALVAAASLTIWIIWDKRGVLSHPGGLAADKARLIQGCSGYMVALHPCPRECSLR